MRLVTLFLIAAFAVSTVGAASYQKTDGTVVDPIQGIVGGIHSYSGINLEPNADLANAYLERAYLRYADLTGADLHEADLHQAYLYDADLTGADLWNANLRYAFLDNSDLTDAILVDANLPHANLIKANLTNANLSGAFMVGAVLNRANLVGSNISAWQLRTAASVTGVNMAGRKNMLSFDLNGLDLSNANLSYAYMEDVRLSGANLSNASLYRADLRWSNLTNADLTGADLTGADLSNASLWDAQMYNANLDNANLSGSNLSGVLYASSQHTTWTNAYYYINNVPTWRSGMDQAWRDSVGILAIGPGDFNYDGVVDAADYTVLRDNQVPWDPWERWRSDYQTWKDHFGQSIASGSGADHVPEPTTLLLSLLALTAAPLRVRHG